MVVTRRERAGKLRRVAEWFDRRPGMSTPRVKVDVGDDKPDRSHIVRRVMLRRVDIYISIGRKRLLIASVLSR
jgi:hypothetical protein